MFKKIGLSAAAILAVVALAKPSAAMAEERNDSRGDRDHGRSQVQEYREYREYRESNENRRPEWGGRERRGDEDRDHDGDRNWR